jgi:hypothetical protein
VARPLRASCTGGGRHGRSFGGEEVVYEVTLRVRGLFEPTTMRELAVLGDRRGGHRAESRWLGLSISVVRLDESIDL